MATPLHSLCLLLTRKIAVTKVMESTTVEATADIRAMEITTVEATADTRVTVITTALEKTGRMHQHHANPFANKSKIAVTKVMESTTVEATADIRAMEITTVEATADTRVTVITTVPTISAAVDETLDFKR